jgi:hypothetical protein
VLRSPVPSTEKWRFYPSKNRHFPPFFASPTQGARIGFVVDQAFQPDIPNVRLESLTYSKGGAVAPVTAR